MKIKEKILKKTKLYTNEKYFILFSELLENVPNLLLEKSKEKKLIFNDFYNNEDLIKTKDNKLLIKIKTDKYWKIIKKNFFKNVLYKKRYFSQMEINYITFLAKTIYSKLVTIALETNELIERLIEIYLKMCKKEMKRIMLILERKKQRLLEIENEKKGIKKKKTFYKNQIEEEDESDEDEVNSKKKVVNLFIGRFDVEKFFNKEQVIEFKQGSFVNAFIFKDKTNTENKVETKHNNNKEIVIFKNKKHNNNNNNKTLSSPNLKENHKNHSNNNNTHRFGSLSYIHRPLMLLNKSTKKNKKLNISIKEENSLENTKEEKFDKKKLIIKTQSNSSYKNSKNKSNNLDKNLFLKTFMRNKKKSNKFLSKETLKTYNTINTMSLTKRLESDYYLPNIFDNEIKFSYNQKMKKDKILNFLKKKDFYY